jgi:hypothetical protein
LVLLDADVPTDDARDELSDLLARSHGENLGFVWLEGAKDLRLDQRAAIDPVVAARLVWLDRLVMNADRTERNPNVLFVKRKPWLIDHGACLPFQYDWGSVTEDSPRAPGVPTTSHLLGAVAAPLATVDAECAARLGRTDLTTALATVPDSFLADAYPGEDLERVRARYVAFLWKRLATPRPFLSPSPAA